jgi:hypothetical protein
VTVDVDAERVEVRLRLSGGVLDNDEELQQ